jgi:hypothetical protein
MPKTEFVGCNTTSKTWKIYEVVCSQNGFVVQTELWVAKTETLNSDDSGSNGQLYGWTPKDGRKHWSVFRVSIVRTVGVFSAVSANRVSSGRNYQPREGPSEGKHSRQPWWGPHHGDQFWIWIFAFSTIFDVFDAMMRLNGFSMLR